MLAILPCGLGTIDRVMATTGLESGRLWPYLQEDPPPLRVSD